MGIDHHKQCSHITFMDEKREVLKSGKVANYHSELENFFEGINEIEAVIKAGRSSYTMVHLLDDMGIGVTIARPKGRSYSNLLKIFFNFYPLSSTKYIKGKLLMDSRIEKALSYINKNLDRKFTLEKIAGYCKLSNTRFSELFRQEMGICFSMYLRKIRIEKAKELLTDNTLSIKQIYYKVGYKYASNFNHDFKKLTGLSPSSHRRKHKEHILLKLKKLASKIVIFTKSIVKYTKRIVRFTK